MKTEMVTLNRTDEVDEAMVDTALGQLRHLLKSQEDIPKHELETAIAVVSHPAQPEWIMARIASLLNPYYEREAPHAVRVMEAEDWAEALTTFPQWAIDKAVRWWKSADNPNRRKRPMEGDIAARVKIEMDAVNAARIMLNRPTNWLFKATPDDTPRRRPTEEEKARAKTYVREHFPRIKAMDKKRLAIDDVEKHTEQLNPTPPQSDGEEAP